MTLSNLKKKFEKREKREYTKEDYYNDFYKIWAKTWKKMDKYRIDSYRKQGMTYDEAVQKVEEIAESELKKNKIHFIQNEIWGEDKEISKTFIFLRNLLWAIIYYGLYKIIEFIVGLFFKYKKANQTILSSCKENTIVQKILSLPKMSKMSVASVVSMPAVASMSSIINQDICSPECSPKKSMGGGGGGGGGCGLSNFLMNVSL